MYLIYRKKNGISANISLSYPYPEVWCKSDCGPAPRHNQHTA